MAIIIAKNSDFVNEDRESLDDLSTHFKKFKAHNYETVRAIEHVIECIGDSKVFRYKDTVSKIDDRKIKNKVFISDYFSPSKQVRIKNCNTWGEFVKFEDGNKEIKQKKSNACNTHLLCPFCASRKASKIQKRVEDFFYLFSDEMKDKTILSEVEQIINNEFEIKPSEHTINIKEKIELEHGNILNYHWYYMVLTVRNDFDADKCFNHCRDSFNKIREKIKNIKRGKDKHSVFKILGAVYSIEITYNPKFGFHPHINIMCAFSEKIPDLKMYPRKKLKNVTHCNWNSKLISDEWLSITGNSFITSCTPLPISKNNHENLKKHLMEILKYSLKFNSMEKNIMVELYPYLFKKRLFGSLGFMYGLGLDKINIEEFVTERKFKEFVMKYTFGIYTFQAKEEKELVVEYENNTGEIIEEIHNFIPLKSNKLELINNDNFELKDLENYFEEIRPNLR